MRNAGGIPGSFDRGLGKTVDWSLVACYLLLVLIGWLNIYASIHSTEPSSILDWTARSGKQAVWIATAFLLDILILFVINPRLWEVVSPYAYFIVLFLLVLVIFVSKDVKGSHSWFELGPVKFQPAEISKITTSLLLAMVMSKPSFRLSDRRHFLAVAAIIGLPMLAILGESETGSALVYVGFLFVLYREGMSGWWLFLLGMAILLFILALVTQGWVAVAVLFAVCTVHYIRVLRTSRREERTLRRRELLRTFAVFAVGVLMIFATDFIFDNVLQDHQRKRIEVLLGLKEDPAGVGYNVRQSMIAIGSGGLFGKGYLQGTQTTYGFVPEQSTDFIFCTVGEEWGFVGCLAVILLYVFLIWRIITDADRSREAFTRIYGYCLASCLFMHLFINIGMTIGLMPVIGIPLPLLSYGGSSLWAFSMMLFIFVALDRQEKKYF
ncbi:MAG: rod shape-determining protein RodA [Bacteroidales bacterium]|jgi:rod shape determining protein RodA|nr:rod shape-determining protein RodA [Bacteroidales bacterium]